ncbi:DUF1564 family protein, partial [Leptospira noguchii]
MNLSAWKVLRTVFGMDILLLDDGQKIESALVEDSVGTDSLLVPDVY